MKNIKNFWRNRYKYFAWCFFEAVFWIIIGAGIFGYALVLFHTHSLMWLVVALGVISLVGMIASIIQEYNK